MRINSVQKGQLLLYPSRVIHNLGFDSMAGDGAEAVIGSVFVKIMESGKIIHRPNHIIKGLFFFDKNEAKVDDFRGDMPNDMNSQDF